MSISIFVSCHSLSCFLYFSPSRIWSTNYSVLGFEFPLWLKIIAHLFSRVRDALVEQPLCPLVHGAQDEGADEGHDAGAAGDEQRPPERHVRLGVVVVGKVVVEGANKEKVYGGTDAGNAQLQKNGKSCFWRDIQIFLFGKAGKVVVEGGHKKKVHGSTDSGYAQLEKNGKSCLWREIQIFLFGKVVVEGAHEEKVYGGTDAGYAQLKKNGKSGFWQEI
jgi:hypothetical protein